MRISGWLHLKKESQSGLNGDSGDGEMDGWMDGNCLHLKEMSARFFFFLKWEKKRSMEGKQQCLPRQTAEKATWKFPFSWSGRSGRKGRGGVLMVDLMWVLSACLITAQPEAFPPSAFQKLQTMQASQGPQHFNAPHLIFIWGFLTNPHKNAPLSRAAAQINYYCI